MGNMLFTFISICYFRLLAKEENIKCRFYVGNDDSIVMLDNIESAKKLNLIDKAFGYNLGLSLS